MKRKIVIFSIFIAGFIAGITILNVKALSEIPDKSPDLGTVIPNFQGLIVGKASEYIDVPDDDTIVEIAGPKQGLFVSGKIVGIEILSNQAGISSTVGLPIGRGQGIGIIGITKTQDAGDQGIGIQGEMTGYFGYGISGVQSSPITSGGAGMHGYSKDSGTDNKSTVGYLARRESNGNRYGAWGQINYEGGNPLIGGLAVEIAGKKYGLFTDADAKIDGSLMTNFILAKNPGDLSLTSDSGKVKINDIFEVNGNTTINGDLTVTGNFQQAGGRYYTKEVFINAPNSVPSANCDLGDIEIACGGKSQWNYKGSWMEAGPPKVCKASGDNVTAIAYCLSPDG